MTYMPVGLSASGMSPCGAWLLHAALQGTPAPACAGAVLLP